MKNAEGMENTGAPAICSFRLPVSFAGNRFSSFVKRVDSKGKASCRVLGHLLFCVRRKHAARGTF